MGFCRGTSGLEARAGRTEFRSLCHLQPELLHVHLFSLMESHVRVCLHGKEAKESSNWPPYWPPYSSFSQLSDQESTPTSQKPTLLNLLVSVILHTTFDFSFLPAPIIFPHFQKILAPGLLSL